MRASEGGGAGRGSGGVAPLWAVMWVVVLDSFGTATGWFVMFFVAEEVLGFGERENLALGFLAGGVYTVSAALSGRVVEAVGRWRGVSLRGGLCVVVLLGSGSAALPALFGAVGLWAFGVVYFAAMGVMWPMVQAFLSGGRRGRDLRRASGVFNVCWSSSVVVFAFGVSPLVAGHSDVIFLGLAAVHVLSLGALLWFPREAGSAGVMRPGEEGDRHHPGEWFARRMLLVFRGLNLFSYTLMAALSPVLPHLIAGMGVEAEWRTAVGGTALGARLLAFVVFERWHGWHAWGGTPVLGGVLLVVGFGASFFAGELGGLWVLVGGLFVMGVGTGMAYAGAIYFALHADAGRVRAGGWHETVIGAGYTVGPLFGLVLVGLAG